MSFKRSTNKPYLDGSKVCVSDKARAVAALQKEFELLEAKQLDVGEQMAVLVAQQVVLAEKCRIIKQSMMELLK